MKAPLEFRIHGMDCADEVAVLRREIAPLVGSADRLGFDILRGKMLIASGTPVITADQVVRAVGRTGMRAEPWQEVRPGAAETGFWQRRGRTLLTALSGALLVAGLLAHVAKAGLAAALGSEGVGLATRVPTLALVLYAAGIVAGGWFIAPRAWMSVRRLRPDMNLLMTIAVFGAAAIGEWFEAAVVTFLFALSLALESWSIGRARRAVEALLAIAPPTAHLLGADGTTHEVNASDVSVGDRAVVKPGERIPVDGAIRRGMSHVNQAPITGESLPVEKGEGSEVFAGTINGDGALEIEVIRVAGETALAQIIRMVGEAQTRRAPSEQWVDQFAQVYTPAIFAAAVMIATLPPLFGGGDFGVWFYRALVLLVIGCPCALVISTPVSIVASMAAAARNGVLVKGGTFIEVPARLRAVALDKTGTLTLGAPQVVDVVAMDSHTEAELLASMGALEAHSDHPLARAIVAHVRGRGVPITPAEDVQAVQGRGVTATINGVPYWLGSHRYLEELGQETRAVHERLESLSSAGRTVVVMGRQDHVCGFVTLADALRPESVEIIRALHEAGVEHVVMLTGDNKPTADRIAAATGIEEVRAELLPADKVTAVEELVARFGTVAMIGDGVNDAPAMGRASLGIAMGAAGSDAAIEAADVALMSDDLSKLPWLIRHSRRTLRIIRQNVVLSLGVKAVFVVLTFAGATTLWAAIAADMGVSLVVIANALRLLRSVD
jgi:Cd2+/Zn2+-exporting ATPase